MKTIASMAMMLCMGCTANYRQGGEATVAEFSAQGDSTLYGMACEGCNDTIVIFLHLPYDGSDPDTLNILNASRNYRVFGHARIGDKLAMIRNAADPTQADLVIVTEELQAAWCYRVLPHVKPRAGMEGRNAMLQGDSVRALLEVEREYGLNIKNEGVVIPIGLQYARQATEAGELVEYPPCPRYFEWRIFNGHLVLQTHRTDSTGKQHLVVSDTADIVLLSPDTLELRFADHLQGFYRQAEGEGE